GAQRVAPGRAPAAVAECRCGGRLRRPAGVVRLDLLHRIEPDLHGLRPHPGTSPLGVGLCSGNGADPAAAPALRHTAPGASPPGPDDGRTARPGGGSLMAALIVFVVLLLIGTPIALVMAMSGLAGAVSIGGPDFLAVI